MATAVGSIRHCTKVVNRDRSRAGRAAGRRLDIIARMITPIVVFTDGAAKGNPGPGGWGAIFVTPAGEVTELGGRAPEATTNNKMELTGAIEALAALRNVPGRVAIYTDSTYLIQGIRGWIFGWRKRGWKTATGGDVLNRDLWERLDALVTARGPRAVEWHYVRGHAGIPGNERVDEIADGLAQGRQITFYRGPRVARSRSTAVRSWAPPTRFSIYRPKRTCPLADRPLPPPRDRRGRRTRTSASSTGNSSDTRRGQSANAASKDELVPDTRKRSAQPTRPRFCGSGGSSNREQRPAAQRARWNGTLV